MRKRGQYLDRLIAAKDTDYVKLLVGVRRCGKSILLELMKQYLLENGVLEEQILFINFEMSKHDKLRDGKNLHDYIESIIKPDKKTYLFLDEVQEINEWARVVNSLRVSFNIDIYATGSNARVFIGEHLTYLSGRYMTIYVYPLSYKELLEFLDDNESFNLHYNTFLESSFPGVVLEKDAINKKQIQEDIFKTIFERDIILRGKISREREFLAVARYLLEHIGTQISANKIYNTMRSNGVKISYDSVSNYLNLMIKSYFLYECNRYDLKGKEELKTLSKYYVVDFGIRNELVPNKDSNRGRVLENFVYLELIKQGYKVYSGKVGRDYEIDFIAIKDNKNAYIQVTESLIDPSTRERESRVFRELKDNYPRFIISLDTIDYTTSMYKHLNLFVFLKEINKKEQTIF